jgi:hypothetical membrane protein
VSSPPAPRWWWARLAVGVAGTVAFVAVVLVLGAITPGYRPAAETVSRLGSRGQAHPWAARSLFVAYGLVVLATCAPLAASVTARSRALAASVAVYAVAGVVAGLAPKDPDGVPVTMASQAHVGATIVGGAALVLAMVLVVRSGRQRLDRVVAAAAAVGVVVGAVVFRQTWGRDYYGVVERLLLGVALAWVAWLCLRLLARPPEGWSPGPAGRRR